MYAAALFRDIPLVYSRDVDVKGINMYRYVPDFSKLLPPNPFFNSSLYGVRNLSCPMGIPLVSHFPYLQNTHDDAISYVYQLPQGYFHATSSMGTLPGFDVFIDIEPLTGRAVNGNRRLAISYEMSGRGENPSQPGTPRVPRIGQRTLFPLVWAGQYAILTDDQANTLKSLNVVMAGRLAVLIIFLILSVASVAFGVYKVMKSRRLGQKHSGFGGASKTVLSEDTVGLDA